MTLVWGLVLWQATKQENPQDPILPEIYTINEHENEMFVT